MPAHISDRLAIYMSLQAISHQKQLEKIQVQVQKMEDQMVELKTLVYTHLRIMPVNLLMNGFTAKKRDDMGRGGGAGHFTRTHMDTN